MKTSVIASRPWPVVVLIAALATSACTESAPQAQSVQPAPDAEPQADRAAVVSTPPARNRGVVADAITAGGYSYIEVDIDGARYWLATLATAVQPGMKIEWQQYAVMNNFSSKALGRNFEQILFVDRVFTDRITASGPRRGIVTDSVNAAGYSFIHVDENGSSVWLAAPETPLDAGQAIEWSGGSLMRNFTSRTLDRVFEEIIFVGAVQGS